MACCSGKEAAAEGACCGAKGAQEQHKGVQEYYGKTLQSAKDLKENACVCTEKPAAHIADVLQEIHEDVLARDYSCGICIPEKVEGLSVLDLGSGAGRDCFVISKLVGARGHVTGVDMTDEHVEFSRNYIDYHKKAFGYTQPNVQFLKGLIEDLHSCGLADNSVNLVVSNCVLNLCPDKLPVLREVHRVLKPGGEFYFSDVYATRRIPAALRQDSILVGECIAGALYWNDFLRIARKAGFEDPRQVSATKITLKNPAIKKLVGGIEFFSSTFRLFKIEGLGEGCAEDYGQALIYKGTIPTCPQAFLLDSQHNFEAGRVSPQCRATFLMLHESRFKDDFEFLGENNTQHLGFFPCCGGTMIDVGSSPSSASPAPSCCGK